MARKRSLPRLSGNPIADLAIRQPVFTTMFMVLLVVLGLLAFRTLPVNLLPETNLGIVSVRVVYPGAGPQTVADQLVEPIEDALSGISGVDEITANASENVAVIIVQFVDGVDTGTALQEVREQVSGIRGELPADIEDPVYERIDPAADPILTLAVTGAAGQQGAELRELLEQAILPRVEQASGVGAIELSGGLERQINVELNLSQMQARGVLPAQVSEAIALAGADIGLGDTLVGGQEFNLRSPSVFTTPEAIARVGIVGTDVRVGDVAQIVDGVAEPESFARLNGADTVVMAIRKQSGTNTVTVADEALRQLEAAFAAHPELSYTIVDNGAEEVRENVNGAIEEILFAVLFAMVVVWIFFRDLRNTLVTVLGLPVIIVATFAAMSLMGITVNIISLLALSVAVGLVIDDAIVVRENIFRHIERGEEPILASSRGTAQVTGSVIAMTLTVIAIFLPAAFTTGLTGIIFKSFGLTIAAAMAISLVEAFTMAPATAAYWSGQAHAHKAPPARKPGEEELPDEALEEPGRLERFYERVLRFALVRRRLMLALAGVVVALSIFSASGLKFAFIPNQELHQFSVSMNLPPGTPLAATDAVAREVEQLIRADAGVTSVLAQVGGQSQLGTGGAERATFLVSLHHDESTAAVQARLRPVLAHVPGVMFGLPSPETGTSIDVTSRPLQLQLRGTGSIEELAPLADEIVAALAGVPGLMDVESSYKPGKPELRYLLSQERANDYGLTNSTVAATLRALVDGDTASTYREGGEEYDIVVRLRPEDRRSYEELQQVRLPAGGSLVPLAQLVAVEQTSSPTTVRRNNRQIEIVIGGNNIGRNVNDVQADMEARVAGIQLPPGASISFGGATADQQESFGSLLLAMGIGVLLVYMVLATQFASFTQPLLIMIAMPLSVMGAFLAVRLRGLELDITGMIGMILLLGLVVKNSILLVDFTNKLQAAGLAKDDAIARAGAVRLRPILMTSLAIMLGSLPAAIGLGEGAELRRVLATVVIGGVFTSTLLTLLLVPVGYSLLQSASERVERWREARRLRRSARRVPHAASQEEAPAAD